MPRFLFCAILLVSFFTVSAALAVEKMSAPDALSAAERGDLVLIDVRRPSEWRESGIASVAVPLSMHERGFVQGLQKLLQENPGKPIAMICATGGRTAYLQRELAARGLKGVIDVSEGMFGNGSAPGWLKRGLPVRAYP